MRFIDKLHNFACATYNRNLCLLLYFSETSLLSIQKTYQHVLHNSQKPSSTVQTLISTQRRTHMRKQLTVQRDMFTEKSSTILLSADCG